MLGHASYIPFVAAEEHDHLPDGEPAALDVCLSAYRRIAKVDEGKFRAPEAFFDQSRAGITGGPAVAARHALEAVTACDRQTHTDHNRTVRCHCCPPATRCNSCNYCKQ